MFFGLRVHRKQQTEKSSASMAVLVGKLRKKCDEIRETFKGCGYRVTIGIAYDCFDMELGLDLAELFGVHDGGSSALALYSGAPMASRNSLSQLIAGRFIDELAAETDDIDVLLVPVAVWGQFTPALNALLLIAVEYGYSEIVYVSLEVEFDFIEINVMRDRLTRNSHCVLVVGKSFSGSHQNVQGECLLNGTTSPWNTLSIWNVGMLAKTGFLMISDGTVSGVGGGIEEATVIALHQQLFGSSSMAILLDFGTDGWNTQDLPHAQLEWHRRKMESKNERCMQQIETLHLQGAIVQHESIKLNRL